MIDYKPNLMPRRKEFEEKDSVHKRDGLSGEAIISDGAGRCYWFKPSTDYWKKNEQ